MERYLEIGTYIGESINVVSTVCKECHFITASDESPWANKAFCKALNIPDYGNRLVYADNIIPHYVMDSKTFDFSSIQAADLYFIDADHSYNGVYHDTKNVFTHKKEDSIVIWHDITNDSGHSGGVLAVRDAIGREKFENFYIVDNNACGIYIPPKYRRLFSMRQFFYSEEPQDLWAYDTQINVKKM